MISFPLGGGRILIFGQKFDEMESIQVLDLTPDFTVLPNDEAKGMLPIHAYDPMRQELIYFISDWSEELEVKRLPIGHLMCMCRSVRTG